LRQVDLARADFVALESHLEIIHEQTALVLVGFEALF
jgi:hypothetical protein